MVIPTSDGEKQTAFLLRVLAVIVAVVALVIRASAAAWLFLALVAIFYLPVCIAHCVIHFRTLGPPVPDAQARRAMFSDGLLLGAFLFQWDVGDDCGFVTVAYLFTHYLAGRPGVGLCVPDAGLLVPLVTSVLLFVPVIVTWRHMLRERTRPSAPADRGNP